MLTSCRLGRLVVQTHRFKLVSSELPRYQILYDLVQDPLETHDISEQRPAEFAKHREWLTAYLQSAQDLPEAIGTDVPAIDETTRERLKALGYLD